MGKERNQANREKKMLKSLLYQKRKKKKLETE